MKLSGFALHPNFPRGNGRGSYRKIQGRKVKGIVAHTTAGPNRQGLSAARGLANWVCRNPVYKLDENGNVVYKTTRSGKKIPVRRGGGRGWPGPPYPFLVPYIPETVDGKLEVYRFWEDEWWVWSTHRSVNKDFTAVAFAGMFKSRHYKNPNFDRDPHPLAMAAGQELILDYLIPRYGLSTDDVYGHFDFGKPACPGDAIEAWIRETRGEQVTFREDEKRTPSNAPSLDTWKERQDALVSLGFDLGPYGADGKFGYFTRHAIKAFQEENELVADGIWGPRTKRAMIECLLAEK